MATVNFFRIMLGLPSLKLESTDPGIIPCDGGSLSTSGGTGNFNFRAITVGEGIGFVDTTWNAQSQIDRFQIIWNNQIVADSLFVGDSLSSGASGQISDLATALSNGFQENNWNDQTQTFDSTGNTVYPNINPYPSTACLWEGGNDGTDDRIVYNIAPTGSLYDRNDNSGQTPSGTGGNAPSQGTYENAQSFPLADPASGCPASSYKQIGVVADYPSSTAKSWDGNIKLQFYKDGQFPEIIELRVWGTGGTAWNLQELTCPGGGYETMVGLASKNGPNACTNYGYYLGSGYPFTGFTYSPKTTYHRGSIGAASNVAVGDELYLDPNLNTPFNLTGSDNLGVLAVHNQYIVPPPGQNQYTLLPYNANNGILNSQVPGFHAYYRDTTVFPTPTSGFWNEVVYSGSIAGVITQVTKSIVWEEIDVIYAASAGTDANSVDCGLTASLTPNTTFYFNSNINKGLPGFNDPIFSGNPGQPTGTNLSPWGNYPDDSLNSKIPTTGWYVAATNTGCKNAGIPAKVLIYINSDDPLVSKVTRSPMGFNNNKYPCFP